MWKWYLSRPPETRSHIACLSKKALTLIKSALQYKIQIKSRQFCTLRSCTDKSYFIKCTSYGSWTCKNCTRIRICKICSELAHRWGDILVNFDPCINEIFPYYWSTIASIIFFFRTTLYTYFLSLRDSHERSNDLRFQTTFSYAHFKFAWYGFLELLCSTIDFEKGFQCGQCGSSPVNVIMDATTLAHRKDLKFWSSNLQNATSEKVLQVPYT